MLFLTLCKPPLLHAPPCAANQWGPVQGRPASHLLPHSPFRHSLLHWFYTRHLRGIYIRHPPAFLPRTSCSSAKVVVGGLRSWVRLYGYAWHTWALLSDGAERVVMSRWSGRVRQAHCWPYPSSCFITTVLILICISITASQHSELMGWNDVYLFIKLLF